MRGLEIDYVLFGRNVFVKTIPFTFVGHSFLASSSFLLIFSVIDGQRGGLHLLFRHHKQWGPPVKMAKSPPLNVYDWPL